MTIRRRGRGIKTGANSYLNLNGTGEITSQTTKAGSSTYTNLSKGGRRVTTEFGGGYYDVTDTRRGGAGRPRRRRAGRDDGLALDVAIALTLFVVGSAWRVGSWAVGAAWAWHVARRDARLAASPSRPRPDA